MFNPSPTLQKTLSNLGWLSVDRGVRLIGAVFVNAWLTRYLGPEQNGILNYAFAFVGIFTPLAALGMDSIVIRDIVRDGSRKDIILGTAFRLRLLGALCALLFTSIGIFVVRPHDTLAQLLVITTSIGLLFQSFDVIDQWFQSQIQSKFTVYAKNSAFFIANLVKIFLIIFNADLFYFVAVNAMELALGAVGLVIMYRSSGNYVGKWCFNYEQARVLLKNSWPIIITDISIFVQSKIDQVMLRELLNERELGLYAAALKVAEPLSFIPMIIMSSVYPVIVKTKEWSDSEYMNRLTNLYRLMFIITLVVCIPITLFSKPIIQLLYGDQFAFSATLLSFLIWLRFYTNMGVARSIYTSTENLFRHTMVCAVSGSMVNILCNYFFIPVYGVFGSIIASNMGFMITTFALDAFYPKTKRNFRAMITGIATFYKFSR